MTGPSAVGQHRSARTSTSSGARGESVTPFPSSVAFPNGGVPTRAVAPGATASSNDADGRGWPVTQYVEDNSSGDGGGSSNNLGAIEQQPKHWTSRGLQPAGNALNCFVAGGISNLPNRACIDGVVAGAHRAATVNEAVRDPPMSAGQYGGSESDDLNSNLSVLEASRGDASTPHTERSPGGRQRNAQLYDDQSIGAVAASSLACGQSHTVRVGPSNPTTSSAAAAAAAAKAIWRRREQQESGSTEGSLRALLNKLAPSSDTFGSLANQVAGHFLHDEAPDELARQLVDRAQHEVVYAATYAKLCSVLVRVRSGFVFYKQLMMRCRLAFDHGIRMLIIDPMETNEEDDGAGFHITPAYSDQTHSLAGGGHQYGGFRGSVLQEHQFWQSYPLSPGGPPPNHGCASNLDEQRHRLKALVLFLCHLFMENLLSFDRLYEDYLKMLEVHLPGDDVAIECICCALSCAGQALQGVSQQWVNSMVHQLQAAVRITSDQRKSMRMIFMVQDLVELHQRNWRPRDLSAFAPAPRMPRDQAEP